MRKGSTRRKSTGGRIREREGTKERDIKGKEGKQGT